MCESVFCYYGMVISYDNERTVRDRKKKGVVEAQRLVIVHEGCRLKTANTDSTTEGRRASEH